MAYDWNKINATLAAKNTGGALGKLKNKSKATNIFPGLSPDYVPTAAPAAPAPTVPISPTPVAPVPAALPKGYYPTFADTAISSFDPATHTPVEVGTDSNPVATAVQGFFSPVTDAIRRTFNLQGKDLSYDTAPANEQPSWLAQQVLNMEKGFSYINPTAMMALPITKTLAVPATEQQKQSPIYQGANAAGQFATMAALSPFLTPIGAGAVTGTLNAYGQGATPAETFKEGALGGLFMGAGSLAGKALGKVGSIALDKAGLGSNKLAQIANQAVSGAGFGVAGTAATSPFLSADQKPTAGEYGINALTGGVLGGLGALGKVKTPITKTPIETKPIIETKVPMETKPIVEPKRYAIKTTPAIPEEVKPTTVPIEQKAVKPKAEYKYNLPDDEITLQKLITDLASQKEQGIKINLQLFAEAQKKLADLKNRRFASNSVLNSAIAPEALKAEVKANMPQYEPISNKTTWEKATSKVAKDYELAKDEFYGLKNVKTADDTALGEALITRAIKDNNFREANRLTANLAEKLTEAGQSVQAAAIFKKLTPEGMLQYAQKVVNLSNKELAKKNPKLIESVKKETADTKQALNKARTESIDNLEKEINKESGNSKKQFNKIPPEQMLANKVINTVKSAQAKKADPIKEMVNELFKIAKESPLPKNKETPDPIKFVENALNNKTEYRDVWQKAKDIVLKKYSNDTNIKSLLDNYINAQATPAFSRSSLTRIILQGMKDLEINLGTIVKNYYISAEKTGISLADYLKSKMNLSDIDAKLVSEYIQQRFDVMVKEKSRTILNSMFKDVPVKDKKNFIDKIMELINLGAYDDATLAELIKTKKGLPSLTAEDTKYIIEHMKKMSTLPEGRAKDIEYASIAKRIQDKIPSTLGDKIRAFQRINLLFNTVTQMRNIGGNIFAMIQANARDIVETPIDIIASKFTGKRTATLPNIKAQIEGMKTGLKHTIEDYRMGIDTYAPGTQYEIHNSPYNIFNKVQVNKNDSISTRVLKNIYNTASLPLNKLDQLTRTALRAGDQPFYEAAYNDVIAQQLKLSKLKTPTAEMKALATEEALHRTYQDVNFLTQAFKKAQQALNEAGAFIHVGTKNFGAGNIVIPFVKTPANLLARAIEYSPFSLGTAFKEAWNIHKGTFNQRKFVDAIAKTITGTATIMLGYDLAQSGIITGRADKDTDVKQFNREIGKLPYAFKVGDKYFSYDWAQPVSFAMAIGADMFFSGKERKDATNAVLEGLKSGGESLWNQSLLQGMSRLFGGFNPIEGVTDVALNAATQFVPLGSTLRRINMATNPYQRETYSPNEIEGKTINPIKNMIPGTSQTLPAKIGVMGEPLTQYQDNPLAIFLSPANISDFNPTPVQTEILRLYEMTGDKSIFPSVVDKSITINGKSEPLSTDEWQKYQQLAGQKTMESFNQLINMPEYRGLSDEAKVKALAKRITDAKSMARNEILKNRGVLPRL